MGVEPGELDVDDQVVLGEVPGQRRGARRSRPGSASPRRPAFVSWAHRLAGDRQRRQHREAEEPPAAGIGGSKSSAGAHPDADRSDQSEIVARVRSSCCIEGQREQSDAGSARAAGSTHPWPPARRGPIRFRDLSLGLTRHRKGREAPRANNLPRCGRPGRGPCGRSADGRIAPDRSAVRPGRRSVPQYRHRRVESLSEGRIRAMMGPGRRGGRGRVRGRLPAPASAAGRNLAGVDRDVDDGAVGQRDLLPGPEGLRPGRTSWWATASTRSASSAASPAA